MKVKVIMGRHYDNVLVDGQPLDPVPSQKVWNHSPDGFSWGYGGSGPAQLALALLLYAGVPEETAVRLHQDYKFATVAQWPQTDGEYDLDPLQWAAEHTL